MADNNSFSISRKGYACTEVDEYVNALRQSEAQLRESYASLQEKYDALYDENAKLRKDCTTLAIALQRLREASFSENGSEADTLRQENMTLKTENEELKAELESARNDSAEAAEFYGNTASKMIEEVAQVVQKLEKDAQRKAEAITAAARLEQEKATLMKERVNHEVRSLMSMLGSFASDTEKESTTEAAGEEETE
ncbi:MAG: hypothetical protein IKK49_09705 [Clostridia bacterium]|nr:hypothetical protein [Clostridia bacterium]